MINNFFFLLAAGTLAMSWLMPNHSLPWASWHSEAVAFLAASILAWSSLVQLYRFDGPRTVALPWAAMPFIGLAGVGTLQHATGLIFFWGDVWTLWFYMVLCIACLIIGFAAASPFSQARSCVAIDVPFTLLAFVLLFGALASTAIALAQVFSLWEHSGWIERMPDLRRPGGNLAQPNHLATLLVMGMASLVFLYQSRKFGAIASGLLVFVLCAGIAATESRTGALSLLILLGWWLFKRRVCADSPPAWVGVGCGFVFVAMFLSWPLLLNSMLLSDQAAVNTTSSLRLEVWRQLLEAIALKPWLGWGIHEVAQAHNAVAHSYAVSSPFSYSHNLLLDLALWVGVPLMALAALMTGIWLWRRIKLVNDLLPWYGLAVALPLAVHSMLEYPFAYAYFLVPVMFALGATEASLGVKPLVRMSIKPVSIFLLLTTAVLAWSVVEYLEIEEDFRVARFEALRIGSPPPKHQPPKVILFDQLAVLLDDARIRPTPNMSPEAMQTVKDAALHYPWSATQYRYALALALNGNQVEAARQFQVMRHLWGEKAYTGFKKQIENAAEQYSELRQMNLP